MENIVHSLSFLMKTILRYINTQKHTDWISLKPCVRQVACQCLNLFSPDYLKVASRDLTNLPLLTALAETKIPIILSTGMAGKKELDDALEVITKYHNDISISSLCFTVSYSPR